MFVASTMIYGELICLRTSLTVGEERVGTVVASNTGPDKTAIKKPRS